MEAWAVRTEVEGWMRECGWGWGHGQRGRIAGGGGASVGSQDWIIKSSQHIYLTYYGSKLGTKKH